MIMLYNALGKMRVSQTTRFKKKKKNSLYVNVFTANDLSLSKYIYNMLTWLYLVIQGYSDKQKVLLEKIMDKLTSFQVLN